MCWSGRRLGGASVTASGRAMAQLRGGLSGEQSVSVSGFGSAPEWGIQSTAWVRA